MKLLVGDESQRHALLATYEASPAHFFQVGYDLTGVRPGVAFSDSIVLGDRWLSDPLQERLQPMAATGTLITASEPHLLHQEMMRVAAPSVDLNRVAYQLVYNDVVRRAWYAYPLIVAIAQGQRMGLRRLHAIELGVFTGDGLRNL